ncbi:MAG: ATP-binding protein [Aquincola sp.]|nr:ATP-binding protein [Aquincola sp.]
MSSPQGAAATARADGTADHVRALFEQTTVILAGNAIGIALIAFAFWPLAPRARLSLWLIAALALWGLRLAHYLRYRRRRDAEASVLMGWRASWRVLVLLQGAMWPLAVWLFWNLGSDFHTDALILIAYSYTLGSVQLLATQPVLFSGFVSLVLLPIIVRVASDVSQPWHWQLAGVLALLFGITLLMGRTYRDALSQAIGLKQQTDQLAEQLKREKAIADDARRVAEAASRAKTQFFAAASHDLRQPLHAMGLFAEALRQKSARVGDPEVAALVNSINQSVDALEGLFGELLDMTRIDSGGVDVQSAAVRMRDLFARLRLTFEPTAFEKGLALSFHGGHRVAHTDALLLDRILRNLVSNAIRHTEDGGVVVACRPVPGDPARLRVQVWDSGVGIPEASLPRIFDEFYQVNHGQPLPAHQRRGLGLGLAIVKRLAGLLDAPLTVLSRVGHGTVFTLEVPVGREPRTIAPPPSASVGSLGITLNGRRIVVVEDEPAVREGLVVLLEAWGATVEALPDLAAVQAWRADPQREMPDLAIVDYRLPEGHTGVQALAAMRARWPGRALPAIVVTGSSLGGHEEEAGAHDFHLLTKPVLPNKLRAMIAFKLGVR